MSLEATLFTELCRIPIIDPHSHINPHAAAAKTLDDILGYHYYTELAHSAGMPKDCLTPGFDPKERVRTILSYMDRFENTVQYSWFLEIARTFLGFEGDRVTAADADWLWNAAEKQMSRPDWEEHVLKVSNVEKIFLTNDFDDPLEGFDTERYVPCLRVDDLVFKLHEREVCQRLSKAVGIEIRDAASVRDAIGKLFGRFTKRGAKACAISLPPGFSPVGLPEGGYDETLTANLRSSWGEIQIPAKPAAVLNDVRTMVFWILCEFCREFNLPFDLMIGVNRQVYQEGVYQGQDLFDQRTSLIQYSAMLNWLPDVTFPISVLTSGQNQELASYAWIFPNVVTSGHWWYSNIPVHIERDLRARLQAVPATKQIGYYSDAYKLEFILPKYNMYRRILARVLAQDFVRDRGWSEMKAIELGRMILRDNVQRIFKV
jgi:glucuronate isomerase